MMKEECIVTVFTGFVGVGKTTIILSLLKQIEQQEQQQSVIDTSVNEKNSFSCVWLKNEYGAQEIDSLLMNQSGVIGTKEILNGCFCCTAVGKLSDSVKEILDSYKPKHLLIETSGSALPATLVIELNRLKREENLPLRVESVICVIDCLNHIQTAEISIMAPFQAKYTDLILLNKTELIDDTTKDKVIDLLNDAGAESVVKIITKKGEVDPALIFGLQLFSRVGVNAMVIDFLGHAQHWNEQLCVLDITCSDFFVFHRDQIDQWLKNLNSETVYRLKGVVAIQEQDGRNNFVINSSFGRFSLTRTTATGNDLRITIMGSHELALPRVQRILRNAMSLPERVLVEICSGGRRHVH